MGRIQEERQDALIAFAVCKFAGQRCSRDRPFASGAIISDNGGQPERDLWPPRRYPARRDARTTSTAMRQSTKSSMSKKRRALRPAAHVAPNDNIELRETSAPTGLRPLVSLGKAWPWSRAETKFRAFSERTNNCFPAFRRVPQAYAERTHPLSVAAARNAGAPDADVVFLMVSRFNWIFHFGQPPPNCEGVKSIRSTLRPRSRITRRRKVALVVPAASSGASSHALAGRQLFYPKDTRAGI